MDNAAIKGLSHKPKVAPKVEDKRKHGYAETRIKHHPNGSHTVEHHKINGGHEPMSYAASDMNDMHDGLEEHLAGKPSAAEVAGA